MTELDDVYLALDRMRKEIEDRLPLAGDETAPAKPRALRKDDVLAALLAKTTQTGSEHSSIRLARNAKGDTQIEVVVRSGDSPEIQTASDAAAEANRLYTNFCELYPLTVGPTRE